MMGNKTSSQIEEFFKKLKLIQKYPEGTFKTMDDCKAVIRQYGEFINKVKVNWRSFEESILNYSPSDLVDGIYTDLLKSAELDEPYFDFEKKKTMFLRELLKDLSWDLNDTLKCIPEQFKTEELYAFIAEQNGYALEHIPKEFWSDKLCLSAFLQVGNMLAYIPEDLVKLVNKRRFYGNEQKYYGK